MQPGEGGTQDFRDPRNLVVQRLVLRACQPERAIAFLAKLGRGKWLVEFFRNRRSRGTPADRDAAGEDFTRLDKEKVRGSRADIDQQRTTAQLAVVVTKRVGERHRRQVHNRCAQPGFLDRSVNFLEQIRLDRDQDHLNLFAHAATNDLVVPDNFVDRERNVLLRLERNDPLDLFGLDRRQFHEPREDRLLRHGVVNRPALDLQLVQHLAQSRDNLRASRGRLSRVGQELARAIAAQNQSAIWLKTKRRQLETLRAEIKRSDACPGGHSTASIPQSARATPAKNSARRFIVFLTADDADVTDRNKKKALLPVVGTPRCGVRSPSV